MSDHSVFDVQFRMYAAGSTNGVPVHPETARFGHDANMNGTADLTFHAGERAVTDYLGSTLGAEFPEVSVRMFHAGDLTRPIWGGVAVQSRLSTAGRGRVDVSFEHFWQHFHRRRAVFAASYAAVDYNVAAENVLLGIQRAQIGAAVVTPTGAGTRTDFGNFTPTVVANHGSPTSGTRRHIVQSGNNLLDVANQLCEAADLAPKMTDSLNGSFSIDNEYPFAKNDLTTSVIFGQYHGNLASFEIGTDRASLANRWFIEGKTANSPQVASDATSITAWGEFEAYGQKPEDSNVNAALLQTATDLRDGYAEARVTYKADLIEVPGSQFVQDFWWRDTIRIEDAVFGVFVEQTVKAWEMTVDRGRLRHTDIVLGVPKAADFQRRMLGYVGMPGPRFGGSPFRNRRQA